MSTFESTGWVEQMCRRELTPFQARCCEILAIISGGIHNAPIQWSGDGVTWDYGRGFSVLWRHDHLATWDTSKLTFLVMLCCDARIRLEISAGPPRRLRLSFWQRQADGRIFERHPSLDEFVAGFREQIPHDHPLLYRNHTENLDARLDTPSPAGAGSDCAHAGGDVCTGGPGPAGAPR